MCKLLSQSAQVYHATEVTCQSNIPTRFFSCQAGSVLHLSQHVDLFQTLTTDMGNIIDCVYASSNWTGASGLLELALDGGR